MKRILALLLALPLLADPPAFEKRRSEAMSLAAEGQFRDALFELGALLEEFPAKKDALEADLREVEGLADAALEEAIARAKKDPERAEAILGAIGRRAPEALAKRAEAALKEIRGAGAGKADELGKSGKWTEAADALEAAGDVERARMWRRFAWYDGAAPREALLEVSPETLQTVEFVVEEFLSVGTPEARDTVAAKLPPGVPLDVLAAVILRGGRFEALKPGDREEEFALPDGQKRRVLISIPEGYTPTKLWPVFMHLHGTNASLDMCRGDAPHFRAIAAGRWIVVQPESARFSGWGPMSQGVQQAPAALRHVRSRIPVDPDRVWLSGHSMGAHGTWLQAMRHADLWAAYVPKAGSPYRDAYGLNWKSYIDNLRFGPTWFIHGARDPMFPVKTVREFADLAKERNLKVDYHEYADSGHEGAPSDEIRKAWDWMAKQAREPYPKTFEWNVDNADFGRMCWVEALALSTKNGTDNVRFLDQHKKPVETRQILKTPAKLTVSVEGQTITIKAREVEKLRLYWTPHVVDLGKDVVVKVNGFARWRGVPEVGARKMLDEAQRTGRRDVVFHGSLDIDIH